MRHSTIDPAPALRSLIAAMPDDRLREFTLEILLGGMTAKALPTPEPAPTARRARGRPRGHKSGPRSPAVIANMRLAQQRRRDAEKKREKRAAARAAAAANDSNGGNDGAETMAAPAKVPPAQALWQHAAKLQPKAPWRVIVREFGINEAVAQDAHRTHKLPPGITGDAVSRFLELPAS
jgi:hypothetical protein